MQRLPDRLVVKAGQVIYRAGDPAGCAYFVLKGRLDLLMGRDGEAVRTVTRSRGDMLGGRGLMDGSPRNATAIATEPCELLVITGDLISNRLAETDPLLRSCLLALMQHYNERGEAGLGRLGSHGADRADLLPVWHAHARNAREMLFFEYELRGAIERGEFELCFQPIVRLLNGRLAGFEALIRWRHPERGLLLPNDFIPAAERSGLISQITMLCVSLVGATFPDLQRAQRERLGATDRLFISINVSGHDLMQDALASRMVSSLLDSGVEPEDVKLEITESVLMQDAERCARTLEHCRDQGFAIAIDDFGTGYSSLHYLNSLPIGTLKIDRSFCQSLVEESSGGKIINAIVQLGRSLGMSVVAEGVETARQREILTQLGCDFGQGFLFGPPRSHAETIALIRHWGEPAGAGDASPLLSPAA